MEKQEFVTEQMIYNQASEILNQDLVPAQKEVQLFVLQYILELLSEGKLLTINEKKEIKLWEKGSC